MEYDVVCLSHLRWDFVFQRPQHLMTRCARRHRVFFVERPLFDTAEPRLDVYQRDGVRVVVPHLPTGDDRRADEATGPLLDDLLGHEGSRPYVVWCYGVARSGLRAISPPIAAVYDCVVKSAHSRSGALVSHKKVRGTPLPR